MKGVGWGVGAGAWVWRVLCGAGLSHQRGGRVGRQDLWGRGVHCCAGDLHGTARVMNGP